MRRLFRKRSFRVNQNARNQAFTSRGQKRSSMKRMSAVTRCDIRRSRKPIAVHFEVCEIVMSCSYLKALGITTIELMPVQSFLDEQFLHERGMRNYWGYNTLGFFAPESRYLAGGRIGEFQDMVNAIHDANLEVILDVVYNHTAEGNHLGPTLSFRGIDNSNYYRLPAGNLSEYVNDSGCGNTINIDHPQVRRLILDSLGYWVTEMGVDGFRFRSRYYPRPNSVRL